MPWRTQHNWPGLDHQPLARHQAWTLAFVNGSRGCPGRAWAPAQDHYGKPRDLASGLDLGPGPRAHGLGPETFFSTCPPPHRAKQAPASSKPHGPKDYAGATGLNFAQSSAGRPESSQLSEPAWWLHTHFGRWPSPCKQFVQAVSTGGQATRPCQSIPRKVGANATQWSRRVATPSVR